MSILPIFLSVLAFYTPRDQGLRPSQPLNYTAFYVCDFAVERPTFGIASPGDMSYAKDTGLVYVWSGVAWVSVAGGGGGAPSGATYITQVPDAGLSAEQALSTLISGLLFNTTGTGILTIYPGSACGANQYSSALSTTGVLTCAQVAYTQLTGTPVIPTDISGLSYWTRVAEPNLSGESALGPLGTGIVISTTGTGVPSIYTGTSCTNQFIRSLNASGAGTCNTVSLTADVSGTLPVGNGGTGVAVAADDTILVGDGALWAPKTLPNTFGNGMVLGYRTGTNSINAEPVYQTVQDEGVAQTQRPTLNLIGAGVACVDNAGATRTDCTFIDTTSASTLLDTLGSVQGSILERGATGWQVILPGAQGAVLTATGSGSDPVWYLPPKPLPARTGLPIPYCNAVLRANWRGTNCRTK